MSPEEKAFHDRAREYGRQVTYVHERLEPWKARFEMVATCLWALSALVVTVVFYAEIPGGGPMILVGGVVAFMAMVELRDWFVRWAVRRKIVALRREAVEARRD